MDSIKAKRNFGLDLLRVLACYMVVQVHAGEFYYIGNDGSVLHTMDAYIVGWYNSGLRSCVPLFVMLSGFFLFPVNNTGQFLKKRLTRVAVPFVIWCALYAIYMYLMGQATLVASLTNILKIPVNFGTDIGHLWYVYMLVGIYLFAPLVSHWVQTASRRGMELYLMIWALAITEPYIHLIFPAILGECFWNTTPMLYYFSGFLGYVILANYIKRFHMQPKPWNYPVGLALIAVGYAITAFGFLHTLPTEQVLPKLELTWGFETINVAMVTAGIFLIFKNITLGNDASPLKKIIEDVSAKSYGIYLAHIMVLNTFYTWLNPYINTAAIKVPLIAVVSFAGTYLVIKCLSYLPKSNYLVG